MSFSEKAVADLARSGITPAQAEAAGIFEVADASTIANNMQQLPALVLPYYDCNGEPVTYVGNSHFCRVRYLADRPTAGSFTQRKPRRYDQPAASGARAYFPVSGIAWSKLALDTKEPLIITEGEKKTLAACLAGFPTIGLGGVRNYLVNGELLPELDEFKWNGRETYIVFDSDAALNPQIQMAEARLVEELMRKRGARCYLVRLPPLANGDKCGLDDYLLANGVDRFRNLLVSTDALGAVDAAVVALNSHVAWIERESLVYDVGARHFLKAAGFEKGSKYSAETARRIVTGRTPGVKIIKVATEWLTHPLARRYADLLFRPGEGEIVKSELGQPAFNVWHGWDAPAPGDVAPFLELTQHLMSRLPAALHDFALKWLAYKAQNPAKKIPIALVIISKPGAGKGLWTECLYDAFAPYAVQQASSDLNSTFQGWLERNLLCIINEVEEEDLRKGANRLRALISDLKRPMNEKYRVARQINSYTQYILTANERAAGAFHHGDRRMFVVGAPPPREYEFYKRVAKWKDAGGGQALMHWLLSYDLEGWTPPQEAPLTAEKSMAYMESLTDIQKLAEDTLTADANMIYLWIETAMDWANRAQESPNSAVAQQAQTIIDSYNVLQIRDWYTPDELRGMFPQIAAGMYNTKKSLNTVSGEMSRQLRDCGVPYLECADDPRGFRWGGRIQQFLVMAHRDDWSAPLKQADFERAIKNAPRYVDLKQQLRQAK